MVKLARVQMGVHYSEAGNDKKYKNKPLKFLFLAVNLFQLS